MLSAHLDGLGVVEGKVYPGANDDASGTTAVLEPARLLATDGPHRRGILFVAYGAEEPGAIGSNYFAEHPPVPVSEIVANIEFEMIGSADAKLRSGMMMTGFERSDLGELLRAQRRSAAPRPLIPKQRFFERSDNYELALAGRGRAHRFGLADDTRSITRSPTPTRTSISTFMARAIQSLVEPIRWLANSDVRPQWKPGGRPQR